MQTNNSAFDLSNMESPNPFAYGTFAPSSVCSIPSTSGGENMLITNPFNNIGNNNNNNPHTPVLLSPSHSRRSRSWIGKAGKTFQPELYERRFLSVSKFVISFLTLICCLLFANMAQMVVIYNTVSDNNDKKYIFIYLLFPFILFMFLKMNDLNLCNEITYLLNFGYKTTPIILNKNRQIIHLLTFIGFPFLWILYAIINCDWIQSIQVNTDQTFAEVVTDETINSILITLWVIIQFIQFLLCIVCLLYCIQHNIHHQEPKEKTNLTNNGRYSLSMTNPMNNIYSKQNSIDKLNVYMSKIQTLERQISMLQTDLIQCKQRNITANSQLSTEYADQLQEQNQEYRAMLSERDLLKTELENKKSLLSMKKQQIKQQGTSIKSLQQIREENIQTINELKKKLNVSRKEMQKIQILLQIERQNVQKAQQYFDNFA